MKFGILADERLHHRCETMMGVLLAPRSSGTSLYLTDASPAIPDSGSIQAVIEYFDRPRPAVTHELSNFETSNSPLVIEPNSRFPFNDAGIDLIVLALNGASPARARRHYWLLSEIRRVLAPDGELLIHARNRYGYRRLTETLRRSFRESGMLAKIRAFGVGGLELLADGRVLPSQRGLRTLLAKVGFRSTDWFRPLRDHKGSLRGIRPLFSREDEWAAYPPMRKGGKIRKIPQLADEFIVRASVGVLAPSSLQHCLKAIARDIGSGMSREQVPGIERCLVTPKEKMVIIARLADTSIVVRIPLSVAAYRGFRRNLRALKTLATEPSRRALVPKVLTEGRTAGFHYTVESAVMGKPLGRGNMERYDLARVESLMHGLNPLASVRQTHFDGPLYDELVIEPLHELFSLIPETHEQERLESYFKACLFGRQVGAGISHGDFSLNNIFAREGENSGVIDWDDSRLPGLPVIDAISHLCSRQTRRGSGFADTFIGLACKRWPDVNELAFLDRCYVHFRTDPGLHPALVLLFWVHVVVAQLGFRFADDPSFFRTRIRDILDFVSRGEWPCGPVSGAG